MPSILACIAALLLSACGKTESVEILPSDPSILYMGRILRTDSRALAFSYPGTTAMLDFEGARLDMKASNGSGKFMVYIDEAEPVKIVFGDSDSIITIADSLPDGRHTARIVYAIEGYEKNPHFLGFTIYGKSPRLYPMERPALKMEFIGNSITCGYGAEVDDPNQPFTYDTENHTLSYAYLTARALEADFNVVARSGIGIYRYYGGPREGTDKTMPLEYDNTLLYDHAHKWNHDSFHPDIICINLGTNDTSLDNYDIELYKAAYAGFIGHLRQLHPQAKIVLLTGSMLHGKPLYDVRRTLDELASAFPGVYRFDMSEATGELGYGADWHPSVAQHRQMAEELTAYLRTIID